MNAEVVLPFTEEEVGHMLANLDKFNPDEVEELNRIVDELAARNAATKIHDGPNYILFGNDA